MTAHLPLCFMAVSYGTPPRIAHSLGPLPKHPINFGSAYLMIPPGARQLLPDDYESELRLHVDIQL